MEIRIAEVGNTDHLNTHRSGWALRVQLPEGWSAFTTRYDIANPKGSTITSGTSIDSTPRFYIQLESRST